MGKPFSVLIFALIFMVTLSLGFNSADAETKNSKVKLVTNFGEIVLELENDKAPLTVNNFLTYVKKGFYKNTVFHRVIKGFMIQGGGFGIGLDRKETMAPVKNEADNGLSNLKYTIAMARTPEPNSASSQFFINTNNNYNLDFTSKTSEGWGYCVFGKVVKGFDVVDKIESQQTYPRGMHGNVPAFSVIIRRAEIID